MGDRARRRPLQQAAVTRFVVAAAAVALLAGCGGGAGSGKATLWVTRDEGRQVLLVRTVPAGETAMQALDRSVKLSTRYGGRFVQSIDGVSGSIGSRHDWFYFVNGIEADRGAAEYRLHPGDVEWWDYRDWGEVGESVPAVVGAFPEPFLHGYGGKVHPTDVAYTHRRSARQRCGSRRKSTHAGSSVRTELSTTATSTSSPSPDTASSRRSCSTTAAPARRWSSISVLRRRRGSRVTRPRSASSTGHRREADRRRRAPRRRLRRGAAGAAALVGRRADADPARRLPPRGTARAPYLWGTLFSAGFVFLLSPLLQSTGYHVLWSGPSVPVLGQLDVTTEELRLAALNALRLAAVGLAFAVYALLLDHDRLIAASTGRRSVLAAALATRLVPTLERDASGLVEALRGRGLAPEGLRGHAALLSPLLAGSLERGVNLAEAMEARGFGRAGRTRLPSPPWRALDWAALVATALAVVVGALWL